MGYIRFLRANWLFLLAGGLLSFTSSYGQTFFIAIFAQDIRSAFDLTDGEWGGLYTIGTTLSAGVMIWAGALTDRFRIRNLAVFVMLGLAVSCLFMAWVDHWLTLVLVIFVLRFFGQGMMSHLAVVAMARWFVAERGRALSLASLGFSLGQATLPVMFVALFIYIDWRMLWVFAAAVIILTIPVIRVLLRQERTPQFMAQSSPVAGMDNVHWTRAAMLRGTLFWLMVPLMVGPAAWGTALFFQQVHLAEIKGWSLFGFVALMPLFTLSTVAFTFVSGWAIDRFTAAWFVPVLMLPYAMTFFILASAQTLWVAGLAMVIFGVGQGLHAAVPSAFWAEFYGTRYLGAIKSVAMAMMVFGSAIGPGITGWLIDLGIDFPDQMIAISLYFLMAASLALIGILRSHRRIRR